MAVFEWQARDRQGNPKKGEIEAENRNQVLAILRRQGLTRIEVKKKPKEIRLFPEKITDKDFAIFFRQLATMINAGLPLVQCFVLAEQSSENKTLVKLLREIRESLEQGNSLGDTLRKYPQYFDQLTCSLIVAGEQGGILDSILLRLTDYKEKSLALRSKIKSALVYPVSIVVIAFLVTAILMIFVIPVFGEMFADFGADLPAPTKMTMAVSDWFVRYWYIVFGLPVLLVLALRWLYKTPGGRYQMDRLLLNLPVLGEVLLKAAVARFCRTFGTLVAAGVPIIQAMDTVAATAGNVLIERAVHDAQEAVSQGKTLAAPLSESGLFPVMVTQMITIGEQTGNLEDMLMKVAEFYEQDVDTAVENMTALMEPFIMVFLGVVIGGLVVSMYLPIFKMASVV
ncbi:MAG: type II secretion system F family protein [Zetaproteobacteria bacterium]|nr:MAG: type II secretion system F family protein [Zetaproteobacteria bacterium]